MSDHQLRTVNESGFPLQIAVEHLIATRKPGGWQIRYVEHAWRSADGTQNGFIDLVIQNPWDTAVMALECKRVRDVDWIFLTSKGTAAPRRQCKAWITRWTTASNFKFLGWEELPIDPSSPQASMCVVRGQAANSPRPLLERIASEVVASTEALARQELEYRRGEASESFRAYFNVIVTTARLVIGEFDPSKIALADGELIGGKFTEVPHVRFRKQLLDSVRPLTPADYSDQNVAASRESTVIVVNADHLAEFLADFEMDANGANRFF
ncbi:hypothetical protein SAMN05444679_103118 [Variovorax sp. CF079]|uniref:hypothetical protein n=1 Tax=Variovorax sp. CF079 TaxID=1882774 RepID=UPI00088613ED|nr:hypothetical protein [Variovorax sp. CF079]SDC45750.1 hypothetical protein SAMN05444679_103118 [Variovorax sp. CF079]